MPVTNVAELDELIARVKKLNANLQHSAKNRLIKSSVLLLWQQTMLVFLWLRWLLLESGMGIVEDKVTKNHLRETGTSTTNTKTKKPVAFWKKIKNFRHYHHC